MPTYAKQFIQTMMDTWEGKEIGEENATEQAKLLNADRLRDCDNPNWIEEPGDINSGLWVFPDGSLIIISDNGSMVVEP